MELPAYHSPEVKKYVDAVTGAIGAKRAELASVLSDVPAELTEIVERLEKLTGTWNPVELYTADNMDTEKAAFIDAFKRGEDFVPTFDYADAASFDVETVRPALDALRARAMALPKGNDRDRLARVALVAKIDDDLATCDIAEGMKTGNDALVKRGCRAKYPGGDARLTAFATETFAQLLATPPPDVPSLLADDEKDYLKKRRMSTEEQAEAFTWALKKLGIYREQGAEGDGFQVIIDEKATALDVRDKSKRGATVVIPVKRDGTMTADELCALIEHEIGAHARQAVNGKRLFKIGGGALRKDDETLYEGLAIRYEWEFMEKQFGKVRHDMDLSTLYVFAVDIAEKGGTFREVFENQLERRVRLKLKIPVDLPVPAKEDMDEKEYDECLGKAWRTTYRVMRGHTDATNKEGFAMTKDLAYLRGWLMDRQLLEAGQGHANEAAIMSTEGLQTLATMEFTPEDVPVKYEPIGEEYMKMLLAERPKA
jgi:hypothetical protein